MEKTFFWLEVKIMKLSNFEDIINGTPVVVEVGTSGDANVVHIDADCGAKGFVFEDNVPVDEVHHGLKGRWQISEPKIHDGWFKKSVSGFECCFLFVSFADSYVVVAPSNVKFGIYMCVAEILNEVRD